MSANILYQSPKLRRRLSSITTNASADSLTCPNVGKSDICLMVNSINGREYYKKFEHDEIPVKDSSIIHQLKSNESLGKGDNGVKLITDLLTESESKLLYILKNKSKKQTDNDSASSLDSNIKLFKTTVQEIFDKFNDCMKDFDAYKQKYNEILNKSPNNDISDMEGFIKEMIQYIRSTESICEERNNETSVLYPINKLLSSKNIYNDTESDSYEKTSIDNNKTSRTTFTIEEVPEERESFSEKTSSSTGSNSSESCAHYVFSKSQHEYKLHERQLSSEININSRAVHRKFRKEVASNENFRKLAEKKLEVEKYKTVECHVSGDRNIPVKVSHGKKNILYEESVPMNHNKNDNGSASLIYRICTYLCKKLRRN